ncbi:MULTISPECIES: hypothetical protein [unclassified Flavobacterium]|uniref:hypothetical protein n=1 Tax=unclassified Flavobacterium TaxID=196869 RepID=UPI003F929A8A
MTSIITADIINSRKRSPSIWMDGLKKVLNRFGTTPKQWEIYRGDEFQLEVNNPEDSLLVAFHIKAYLKSVQLDVRISIGFGDKTYVADTISESNGSAFVRSGLLFDTLKQQKNNLAIQTSNAAFDEEINLMLRLAMTFMDSWLVQSSEFALVTLENPTLSQEEIGLLLHINQAAVSRRRTRAKFDLVMDLERYFRKKIKTIDL